jgi:hypothetical protein
MKNTTKNIVVAVILSIFFIGSSMICIFHTPEDISFSERRSLAQLPQFSWKGIFYGEVIEDFEDYTLDQFPGRDYWRRIKAMLQFGIFAQKDNNGIYIVDDMIFKIEYPMRENSVLNAAKKLNNLYETYMKGKDINAYYAIIPDKNYFVAEASLLRSGSPADAGRYLSLLDQRDYRELHCV